MTDLPTRIEATASRELDAEIAFSLGWRQKNGDWWKPPQGEWQLGLPNWLGSLDAAASLMPSGCTVSVEQTNAGWECCVYRISDNERIAQGFAPTEAQARAAAAVRARGDLTKLPP